MTLAQVAAAVGGELHDTGADDIVIAGEAFVDSRQVVEGGLFVAVPGERVDGHEYAVDAVSAGAAAALVTRPVGVPAVIVDDSVIALGRLAQHVLEGLPHLRVIGITGSQGKTSTKDILAQLLERAGKTVAPVGSLNTEIGVPLTALRVQADTAYLLSEMGARGRGHIQYLTTIVKPTVGVVLNVGVAHLGEFGTRHDIAAAKGELVEALPHRGLAVLNADDPLVTRMRDRTVARVVTFGSASDADVRMHTVRLNDEGQPVFSLHTGADEAEIELSLVGEHQAGNAAAAAAVAIGLGMPFPDVVEGLRAVRVRSRWRMEVSRTKSGVTIINDAYNANPDSMRAALQSLSELGRRRGGQTRTFAALGEMKELGAASSHEHDAIGRLAMQLGVSQLVVVGDEARPMHEGAGLERDVDSGSVCVPDIDAAIAFLRGAVQPGDVVLVKASRAAGLERIAQALIDDSGVET
jgi:UDP-N-acetylmuramoyl-tripeptide--D-alanyl-D-alanine ligase